MNSKEALERLLKNIVINETILITKYGYSALNDVETIKQDLDKIDQYKKLEEELGIDLITLFKALKSGVWYREWKEPIKHTCGLRLLKSGKSCWGLDNKNYYFPLEEYGKTWSLRKEDLEDDE